MHKQMPMHPPWQVPTYLRRNKAAIAEEQQQIETFMRMREQRVRAACVCGGGGGAVLTCSGAAAD